MEQERTEVQWETQEKTTPASERCWNCSLSTVINISHHQVPPEASGTSLQFKVCSSVNQLSSLPYHHPVTSPARKKALPHKGSSVNILVCSDYPILAHVPFHQRTRKMRPG
jgi:hypothetical protein